jgi:indole-3-glycerol phosphate synthase
MLAALRRTTVALIAEVKHASPSRGVLIEPFDPVDLATTYARHGAAAISVLTDEVFFGGALEHLSAVRNAVGLPVLRKDFVIEPYQVYEGRAAGADAILLIAAVLDDAQMAELHGLASALGMAALVEVHNEAELERALRVEPKVLGVNNRDLRTFTVDTGLMARLAKLIPSGVVAVAESGMKTAEDVRWMGEAGADAVLIGEGLVAAPDIAAQVRLFSAQPKGNRRG